MFSSFSVTRLIRSVTPCLTGLMLWTLSAHGEYYTRLLKDIGQFNISSNPRFLTVFNGEVYLNADDGSSGQELWKSDGTQGGTSLVKDIQAGTGSSNISEFAETGGILFFPALGLDIGDANVNVDDDPQNLVDAVDVQIVINQALGLC